MKKMEQSSYGIWTAIIYIEFLSYTILSQINASPGYRSIPVFGLIFTLSLFLSFICREFSKFKTVILASTYSVIISLIILFHIFGAVDSTFVNYGVVVTAVLASFFWCYASHSEKKTDPAWHWYVFSCVFIIAVCAAFESQTIDESTQLIFIINCICVVVLQLAYFWNVLKTHTSGRKRCRHLVRVAFVSFVALVLLFVNILRRAEVISMANHEMIILSLQFFIGFALLFDFCSVRKTIKYTRVIENSNA